jgi:CRP-like cAMP-binding protein
MSLESEIAQLRSNPVLALFDHEALRLIAFSSDTRILRKDDVLFREGDVSDGGYFIVSGSLSLAGAGSEESHGPAALIGESALFAETRRPATATILEPTVVRRVPRHLMRRVLAEFPETAVRLQHHMREQVATVGDRLVRVHALLPDEE